MNFTIKVETCNVDKVIYKLSEKNINIIDVIRASGIIQINTKSTVILQDISEILNVKRDGFLPQLLFI